MTAKQPPLPTLLGDTSFSGSSTIRDRIQQYYATVLSGSSDLKTSACCSPDLLPERQRRIIVSKLEDEVVERFYGCGSPIPESIDGCTVLDLGCRSGRGAYITSVLVGEAEEVVRLDPRAARRTRSSLWPLTFQRQFFRHGYIEDLSGGCECRSGDEQRRRQLVRRRGTRVFRDASRVASRLRFALSRRVCGSTNSSCTSWRSRFAWGVSCWCFVSARLSLLARPALAVAAVE